MDVFGWYDQKSNEEDEDEGGSQAGDQDNEDVENSRERNRLSIQNGNSLDPGFEEGSSNQGQSRGQFVDDDFIEDPTQAELIRDCKTMQKGLYSILKRFQLGVDQLDQGSVLQLEGLQIVYDQVDNDLRYCIRQCSSNPGSPRGSPRSFSPNRPDHMYEEDNHTADFEMSVDDPTFNVAAAKPGHINLTNRIDHDDSATDEAMTPPSKNRKPQLASSDNLKSTESVVNTSSKKSEPDEKTVWLEIAWSEGYGACVFYYDVETNTTRWELPENAVISKSLTYLEQRLFELNDLISELKQVTDEGTNDSVPIDLNSVDFQSRLQVPRANGVLARSQLSDTASQASSFSTRSGATTNTTAQTGNHLQQNNNSGPSNSFELNLRNLNGNQNSSNGVAGSVPGPPSSSSSQLKPTRSAESAAQETRYGGREACDKAALASQANLQSAAVTFHPFPNASMKTVTSEGQSGNSNSTSESKSRGRLRRQMPGTLKTAVAIGSSDGDPDASNNSSLLPSLAWLRKKKRELARETARRQSQAAGQGSSSPPGLLPWKTFFSGSLVLIIVWSVGFIWSIRQLVFHNDIPSVPEHPQVVTLFYGEDAIPGLHNGHHDHFEKSLHSSFTPNQYYASHLNGLQGTQIESGIWIEPYQSKIQKVTSMSTSTKLYLRSFTALTESLFSYTTGTSSEASTNVADSSSDSTSHKASEVISDDGVLEPSEKDSYSEMEFDNRLLARVSPGIGGSRTPISGPNASDIYRLYEASLMTKIDLVSKLEIHHNDDLKSRATSTTISKLTTAPTGFSCTFNTRICYLTERYRVHVLKMHDEPSLDQNQKKMTLSFVASCPSRTALQGVINMDNDIGVTVNDSSDLEQRLPIMITESISNTPFDGSSVLALDAEDAKWSCKGRESEWHSLFAHKAETWYGMRHIDAHAATSSKTQILALNGNAGEYESSVSVLTGYSIMQHRSHFSTLQILPSFEVREPRPYLDILLIDDLNILFALRADNPNIVDLAWRFGGLKSEADTLSFTEKIESIAWALPGAPDENEGWKSISHCGVNLKTFRRIEKTVNVELCALSSDSTLARFNLQVPEKFLSSPSGTDTRVKSEIEIVE